MEMIAICGDRQETVRLERLAAGYRITVGDNVYDVDAVAAGGSIRSLLIDGRQYEVAIRHDRDDRYWVGSSSAGADLVELRDPLSHLALAGSGGEGMAKAQSIAAYMPGRVVKVLVAAGDKVSRGQGLIILEAMKMENEIQAEADGVVKSVLVTEGQAVEGGDPLFEIG